MWFSLIVWTTVAFAPYDSRGASYSPERAVYVKQWRKLDEFKSLEGCKRAIVQLGLGASEARCIAKD